MKIISRVMLMAVFIAYILLIKNNAFPQDYDDNYYDSEFYPLNEDKGNEGNTLNDYLINVYTLCVSLGESNVKNDYEDAIEYAHTARKYLAEAMKIYTDMKGSLSPEEIHAVEAVFGSFNRITDIGIKEAEKKQINENLITLYKKEKDAKLLLPQVEILERATSELIEEVDSYKAFHQDLINKGVPEELQEQELILITIDFTGLIKMSDELKKGLTDFKTSVQKFKKNLLGKASDYKTFREEDIPAEDKKEIIMDEKIITSDLKAVFKKFDKNNDGKISLGEGEDFFYWMEKNVQYRYDDENAEDPYQGSVVGDGHPGNDYRQTPHETLEDEMGDCEDMATMESAFYNYWGIESYVIGVNAVSEKELDHAAAIVKLSDTPEKFKQIFGNLVSYDIKSGAKDIYGKPVAPGTYFLADNAYSSAFGYLSGGIEKGKFKLLCTVPADKPFHKYDEEEASRVWGYCGPSD